MQVTGSPNPQPKLVYWYYFQNPEVGGGPVEEVSVDSDAGLVHVTFAHAEGVLAGEPSKSIFVVVYWLFDVPETCQCISGTDLLRQLHLQPQSDRNCKSNLESHPVTLGAWQGRHHRHHLYYHLYYRFEITVSNCGTRTTSA